MSVEASLARLRIDLLCDSERTARLDRFEAYYRSKQYEGRRYDWDGRLRAYNSELTVAPGWVIPLKLRRPSVRYDLPRLIVRRFTALVFGEERFPQVIIDGDEDAQDYVRALAEIAGLKSKMQEARNRGGSQGTAVVSFAFIEGEPRVSVHNAKNIYVLKWADWDMRRPAVVAEIYPYPRTVIDQVSGKAVVKEFYSVRYWDESVEVIWGAITSDQAKQNTWVNVPHETVTHGYGFCPVYMAQNRADSDDQDGDSDLEGLEDNFDSINELLSAVKRGAIANVDPTLVIKDSPQNNPGMVKKGSDNAIWAINGADYLELEGTSIKTGLELAQQYADYALAVAGVVLGDPAEMAAKAASAAALRMMYMPMLVEADGYREQYGRHLLVPLLLGMLRAAKKIGNAPPGAIKVLDDGRRVQDKPGVVLPDRWADEPSPDGGKTVKKNYPRKPGTLETITLNWPPYFPATWTDNKLAVEALVSAAGNKPIITQRTAVENAAQIFGVSDVNAEMVELENERAEAVALARATTGIDEEEEANDGSKKPAKDRENPTG